MKKFFFAFSMFCSCLAASGETQSIEDFQFDFIFNQALEQRLTGNIEHAQNLYENALSLNKESAAAWMELSRILLKQKKLELAYVFAEEALKRDSDNIEIVKYELDLCVSLDNYDRTIYLLNKLIDSEDNDNPDKYIVLLSRLYRSMGKYEESLQVLEKHRDKIHNIVHYYEIERAETYLKWKGAKSALKFMKGVYKKYPKEGIISFSIGNTYLLLNDSVSAYPYLDKAVSLPGGDDFLLDYYRTYHKRVKPDVFLQRILSDMRDPKISFINKQMMFYTFCQPDYFILQNPQYNGFVETIFDEIKLLYPWEEYTYRFAAQYFYDIKKDVDKAIEYMKEYFALTAGTVKDWDFLFKILPNNFDDDKYIEQAYYYYPEDARISIYYVWLLMRKKEFEQVLSPATELAERLELNVKDNRDYLLIAYEALANINHSLGNFDDCFKYYEKLIAIDEYNALALNNYAYFLSEKDMELDKAERMSRTATNLEPSNPIYLDTYAWVLFRKGIFAEAKFVMDACIHKIEQQELEMRDISLYYHHYGDILFKAGFEVDALEMWKKALENDPDDDILKRKVETESYVE